MKNQPESLFRCVFGLFVYFSQSSIIELIIGFCQVFHAIQTMQRDINIEDTT